MLGMWPDNFLVLQAFNLSVKEYLNVMGTLTSTTRNVSHVHQLFLLGVSDWKLKLLEV